MLAPEQRSDRCPSPSIRDIGWNPQASWYIARYILGVLGFEFRNPYKLRRQKAFIVPEVIPPNLRERMASIVPWDSWDPDVDRWEFDPEEFLAAR